MSRVGFPKLFVFLSLTWSALSTPGITTTTTSSGQCSGDFCVADRTTFPDLLPPGQITTESFSFTNKGVWYLAGYSSDDGIRTLWRIECNSWVYVAQIDLSNIEASGDNMYVFGISEGAVVVLNQKNSDSFVTIAPADPLKEYTGVAFDSVSHILYVTEKATGDIAR
ncbi:hypothetical protein FOZ62_004446, partial [Perkinsus olseni]